MKGYSRVLEFLEGASSAGLWFSVREMSFGLRVPVKSIRTYMSLLRAGGWSIQCRRAASNREFEYLLVREEGRMIGCPKCGEYKSEKSKLCWLCTWSAREVTLIPASEAETPLELMVRIIGQSRGQIS